MNRSVRHQNAGKGAGKGNAAHGESALIVAAHGRHYVVERADGTHLHAFPRGKKSDAAVGDHVRIELAAADQGVITGIDLSLIHI